MNIERDDADTSGRKKVCVITGGGSGMGLAAARELGRKYRLVIAGRTEAKLESALLPLRVEGFEAYGCPCDVSDRLSVNRLAEFDAALGEIGAVIHAAGLSPSMGSAETVMTVNAQGTVNVHEAFFPLLGENSCLIDISSMSAHLTPRFIMPRKAYALASRDPERFFKSMMRRVNLFPKRSRAGVAYGISKDFVIQYARSEAARFGLNGARVLSVSPGHFDTPMGNAEAADSAAYLDRCAIRRTGRVEEMGKLLAFCVDEATGYLTGTDILCDGGCIASGVSPFGMKKSPAGT